MTLTDLIDPRALAQFLGYDPDETVEEIKSYDRWGGTRTVEIPRTDWVQTWFSNYRSELHREFVNSKHNQFRRPRSHDAFIRECIREGLFIKSKGKTADLRAKCIAYWPDLYTAPGSDAAPNAA